MTSQILRLLLAYLQAGKPGLRLRGEHCAYLELGEMKDDINMCIPEPCLTLTPTEASQQTKCNLEHKTTSKMELVLT